MRVIGVAGWSGAGKTTLLAKVLPLLVARGLAVSTVKHAHHAFDLDRPGKDSHTHRLAGAQEVLIASSRRWALLHELRDEAEPGLADLLRRLSPCDLTIVEGFKHGRHRRIEVFRAANGKPPLHPQDPDIVAVLSDTPFPDAGRPILPLDDAQAAAEAMLAHAEPLDALLARLDAAQPLTEPSR